MISFSPSASAPTPAEQPAPVATNRRCFTIGLPCCQMVHERRFPLTPEAVEMLVEQGFVIKIEHDAAASIHYTDTQYASHGAQVASRAETLGCDIVIHLAPLMPPDIRHMRRGAMLLTLLGLPYQSRAAINELLSRSIIAIALDLIQATHGNFPFADILSEIDGRAAMTIASAMLADSLRGKGILLGGVAGIVPCECCIIGSGIAARAAARSAAGAGASVRIFDNDVYRLRHATRELGQWAVGSALHPRVVQSALRTADVVILTPLNLPFTIDSSVVNLMKRGVLIFDLNEHSGQVIPSLPTVDVSAAAAWSSPMEDGERVCYVNAGSAVPRTAAMALSNTLLTTLHEMLTCEGVINALKLLPGLQKAAYTFLGKVVNPQIAQIVGRRQVDINIFLTLS